MNISDGRAGYLNVDHLDARFDGIDTLPPDRGVYLVELQEEAAYLRERGLLALWPTHGPLSIRCLADCEEQLKGRVVIPVYKSDLIGRNWANLASGILLNFASQVRPLKINYDPIDFFKERGPDEFKAMTKTLSRIDRGSLFSDMYKPGIPAPYWMLNMAGARLMDDAIGLWEDMDCPEINGVINQLGVEVPMVYLNDESLPEEYRIRDVPRRRLNESWEAFGKRCCF